MSKTALRPVSDLGAMDDEEALNLLVSAAPASRSDKADPRPRSGLIIDDTHAMELLVDALDLIHDDIASGHAELSEPVSPDEFVSDFYSRLGKGLADIIARRRHRRNKSTHAVS